MNQFKRTFITRTAVTKIILGLALLSLILSIMTLSCVPPVSRDALTHHLSIPKLYIKHGSIYEIPFLKFSYYPMNLDLLYLLPLFFGNDIAPKFIHFVFALLTAWLIFGYVKKRINSLYALFSVLLFLSIPVIIKLSITAYVDLGLVFFSTAALLYLFKWRDHTFKPRYILISGIFCGLALGTKYNGLIVLLLLTLFVPLILNREVGDRKDGALNMRLNVLAVKSTFLFVATALLVFSPWMIRNTLWTQNPIYPLYDRFFHPTAPVEGPQKLDIFTYRKLAYGESASQTLLIPLRIFFEGKDDNPQYFDGKLNPYLIILPFFALLGIRGSPPHVKKEKTILILYVGFFMLFAFFSKDFRARYVAPALAPLAILGAYGVFQLNAMIPSVRKPFMKSALAGGLAIGLGLLLLPNALYLNEQFRTIDPFSYISGKVTRDSYIERFRPEYPAMEYINRELPLDAGILGFFLGNRGYYLDRPILFYPRGFYHIAKGTDAAIDILLDPQRYGITHLLIRYDLFQDWLKRLPENTKSRLMVFLEKKTGLVFSRGGYGLLALHI